MTGWKPLPTTMPFFIGWLRKAVFYQRTAGSSSAKESQEAPRESQSVQRLFTPTQMQLINSGHIAVENPSTGESLGEIADGDAADIAAVVASAKRGFGLWRDVHPLERAAILRQIAEIVRRNARELAAIDAIDCGNPFAAMINE
jgi:acyl-CoA reductase-like NAD-dependent aldehyde dehydrogenase